MDYPWLGRVESSLNPGLKFFRSQLCEVSERRRWGRTMAGLKAIMALRFILILRVFNLIAA